MTIIEMHKAFKLLCDKTDSLSYDEFTPKEIDFYLNKAQEEFVKDRYTQFEQNIKRREDLRNLVTQGPQVNLIPLYNSSLGEYIIPITSLEVSLKKYMFCLSDRIIFTDTKCIDPETGLNKVHKISPKLIELDDKANITLDPFNKPTFMWPIRLDRVEGFIIDFGRQIDNTRYTPITYSITYLKYPTEVSLSTSISCELVNETHTEIVNIAVRKALENIESYNRYQTQANEINNQNN